MSPSLLHTTPVAEITPRILSVRGEQVLLDSDLAEMYGVETKNINKAVKRNLLRFPESFAFPLTSDEWQHLKFQSGTSSPTHGGRRHPPFAFTEQGVAMLSAVLHSPTAITVSIRIIQAFVEMRRVLLQHGHLFQKIETIEVRQLRHIADTDERFNTLFNSLKHLQSTAPSHGIFFNGQIFDAYTFAATAIRRAKNSIILIDNYLDESVLLLLSKRRASVSATLFTKKISRQLELDLQKHNAQYPAIEIHTHPSIHDRFLILDETEVLHLGASFKDLGKECFAFSRMDSLASQILHSLPFPEKINS
jgi:phage regulator Rha-like protein